MTSSLKFDVLSYLEELEWTVYISETMTLEDTLGLVNHYTNRNKNRKPFRLKSTPTTKSLIDELLDLKNTVTDRGFYSASFLHLKWLKTITESKLPIICYLTFVSRKVFIYLLKLSPTSVLQGLDDENTPFNVAIRYKNFWYYSQMIKKLLVPYSDLDKSLSKDEARYTMYYPAYNAIRNSCLLTMVGFHNDKHLLYLLKILWKCESVKQKRGQNMSLEDYDYYSQFFFQTYSSKVSSFIVRKRLLRLDEDLRKIVNYCVTNNFTDTLEIALIQAKEQSICPSEITSLKSINEYYNLNCSWNPLIYAIYMRNYHIVRILIDYGISVNVTEYESPLMFAISDNEPDFQIIQLLIDRGADINYRTEFQINNNYFGIHNALQLASLKGNSKVIEMLFRYTEVYDDNDVALSKYQKTLSSEDVASRTEWWRRLKSLHKVQNVLLCSSYLLTQEEEKEEEENEEEVCSNFFKNSPGVFEVCLETICGMI